MGDTYNVYIPTADITTLAASGAIDVDSYLTRLTAASTVTLGPGTAIGQRKRLQLVVAATVTLVSPYLHAATTVTFSAQGDRVELVWDGRLWRVADLNNASGTAATPVVA